MKLFGINLTPLHQRLLSSLAVFMVMVVGLAVGTALVLSPQDIRRSAATNDVNLSINTPSSVAVGQQFTASVVVTSAGSPAKHVTAADVTLTYSNNLRLDGITRGNYFSATSMQMGIPSGHNANDYTLNYTDLAHARMAVGAFCDVCYLGSAPSPNPLAIPACGSITPACYPNTGTGTLMTYTFTALSAGTATINFNNTSTQVAATESDTDVHGTLSNPGSITINGASACTGDVNGDNRVDTTDFNLVVSNFAPLTTCTGACTGDVNGDNRVDTTDFNLVVSNFAPLSVCN